MTEWKKRVEQAVDVRLEQDAHVVGYLTFFFLASS